MDDWPEWKHKIIELAKKVDNESFSYQKGLYVTTCVQL